MILFVCVVMAVIHLIPFLLIQMLAGRVFLIAFAASLMSFANLMLFDMQRHSYETNIGLMLVHCLTIACFSGVIVKLILMTYGRKTPINLTKRAIIQVLACLCMILYWCIKIYHP